MILLLAGLAWGEQVPLEDRVQGGVPLYGELGPVGRAALDPGWEPVQGAPVVDTDPPLVVEDAPSVVDDAVQLDWIPAPDPVVSAPPEPAEVQPEARTPAEIRADQAKAYRRGMQDGATAASKESIQPWVVASLASSAAVPCVGCAVTTGIAAGFPTSAPGVAGDQDYQAGFYAGYTEEQRRLRMQAAGAAGAIGTLAGLLVWGALIASF